MTLSKSNIYSEDINLIRDLKVKKKKQPTSSKKKRTMIIITGVLIVLAIAAAKPISDYETIQSADPQMVKLAQEAGMTREGELIFLRTHPQLDTDAQIATDCPTLASSTNSNGFILQGCYIAGSNRIFIRSMPTDYANLEITTAAYELLHPIYSMIAKNGSAQLNAAIEADYNARSSDQNLSSQVTLFAKTEPGAKDDELFSLLGTEYTDISPVLAAYYTPYFSSLSGVVTYNQQEEALIPNLETQLSQLNDTINSDDKLTNTALYDTNSWADTGNSYQYYRNYDIYKADIATENAAIDHYNSLLGELNTLAQEYEGTQPTANLPSVQSQ